MLALLVPGVKMGAGGAGAVVTAQTPMLPLTGAGQ